MHSLPVVFAQLQKVLSFHLFKILVHVNTLKYMKDLALLITHYGFISSGQSSVTLFFT